VFRLPAAAVNFRILQHSVQTCSEPPPPQPPIQRVPGAISLGVEPPGCEAPSGAEVKNYYKRYSTFAYIFLSLDLIKNRNELIVFLFSLSYSLSPQ
jgi:hypothetical protein